MANNHQAYDFAFLRVIAPITKMCGVDFITVPNPRTNWVSIMFMFMMYSAIFCACHSIVTRDISVALQNVVMLGLGLQGLVKFSTFSHNLVTLRGIYKYLLQVYEQNAVHRGARLEMLSKFDRRLQIVVYIFLVIYVSATIMFILLPVFILVFLNEKMLAMPLMLPYVNETADRGYWITVVYQDIVMFGSGFGMLAGDLTLVFFILHVVLLVQLLEIQCLELDAALLGNVQSRASQKVHLFLKNIVGLQTNITNYVQLLCRMNSYVFFIEINGSSLAAIFCVYVILVDHLIAFYPLFLAIIFKLFVFCVMGTVIEEMTIRVSSSINNITWYLLPIPKQRDLIFMIAMSQRNAKLFAGTVPLNLNTFVNVMKNVYSCGMLIVESTK